MDVPLLPGLHQLLLGPQDLEKGEAQGGAVRDALLNEPRPKRHIKGFFHPRVIDIMPQVPRLIQVKHG